ncbi:hypothetical protein FSP39_017822 [Pinctada imbricata]|uniref:Uncharacterized protein n=1 Tax=Pinctada imbricata TaxID=66713 RepID=A0AA88XJI9_PINIB|nr:hypothetical protein FSP39_017822 [Pinctada imbricata]
MLPYEALGLEELLRHFSLGELFILSDFVTQKQAYVNTKKESINAIIKYGRSARDVLVHRQITKKSLVHYMVSNDIDFSIRRTKNALCDIILNFWREKYQRKSKCEDKGEIVLISSDDKEDRLLPVACTESHTYISVQVEESSSKSSVIEKYSTDNSKVIIPHGEEKSTAICGHEESEMDIASPYLQKFGDTFTRWFFERWNSENASLNSIPDSVNGFCPHSFWDNASLMSLCIFPERACVEDQAAGAIAVAKKLSFYVKINNYCSIQTYLRME